MGGFVGGDGDWEGDGRVLGEDRDRDGRSQLDRQKEWDLGVRDRGMGGA